MCGLKGKKVDWYVRKWAHLKKCDKGFENSKKRTIFAVLFTARAYGAAFFNMPP
jgi:hypothetical protein